MPTWRYDDRRGGAFEGEGHGSEISFFVVDMDPGNGPRAHHHPYSETFVVQAGRALFELDGSQVEAGPGDVVVAPGGASHKFTALDGGALRMVTIHAAPRMDTTWDE